MCDAVVLVESDREGGGVVTSKMAFSYEREVFAVPGRISDRWSSGCNKMISSNTASAISSPDDVAKMMGWKKADSCFRNEESQIFPSDDEITRNILVTLSNHPGMDMDSICDQICAECQSVMSALTMLEMNGRIISDDKGLFRIKE